MDEFDISGSISKLILKFPDKLWLGKISRKYQAYRFEILSFMPVSQDPIIGNSLIKITGTNPEKLLPEILENKTLKSLEVMDKSGTSMTITTLTHDKYLLYCIIKNEILVKFPVIVEAGCAVFNVIATRGNIDQFIVDLNKKEIEVEIKVLSHYKDDILKTELTERQYIIFKKARDAGYYNTPREINLTELAEQIGVAKSSLSSMLHRIHQRLLGEMKI